MGSKPRRTASSVMAVCHATQSARHAVRSVGQWSTINQSHSTYDQPVASATSQPRSRPPNAIHGNQSVSQPVSQSVVQHIRSHNGIGLSVLPISQHTKIIRSPSMHAAHSLARCSQTVTRCKQSASCIVQSVSHDVQSVNNAHTRSPSSFNRPVLSQICRSHGSLSHAHAVPSHTRHLKTTQPATRTRSILLHSVYTYYHDSAVLRARGRAVLWTN